MHRVFVVSLVVLAAMLTSLPAAAATIEGSWRGSGIVTHRGGADPVRCRVTYTTMSAKSFAVSSQCATETDHYDVSGSVVSSGTNRYFGLVRSRGQTGRIVIVQHGSRLSVTVTSRRGSAKLSLSRG